jgi:hypothetical protein
MKTPAGIVSRNEPHAENERISESRAKPIHELAHDLFNQLTVINLWGANLSISLQDSEDPGIARNLDMLERAAEETTILAERIAQFTAEPKGRSAMQVAKSSTTAATQQSLTPLLKLPTPI